MASQYVSASSEYGEISLKEEFEKTFIFHVQRHANTHTDTEDDIFTYFIVNPTNEILEIMYSPQLGGGGGFNYRTFWSNLSPSEIKGIMFSGIGHYNTEGIIRAIPYTLKKLLLEREWEFDYDSYTDIKHSYPYKSPLAQFNYGYTNKKMRIQFKNSYLVIPHFVASMTPIDRTTSKYYKRVEILELTKEYAEVLLIYEKKIVNGNPGFNSPYLDIEGTFTWHINGPTLPLPILNAEPVVGDLLEMF